MPNIQTNELKPIHIPVIYQDFLFDFSATNKRGETLLHIVYEDKKFFLKIIKRDKNYIIKYDKFTRISPVSIIQRALKAYKELTKTEVVFSNIEPKKEKHTLQSDNLKDINFFIDMFKTEKEIWVEVGFGSGRHLLHMAKKYPDIQFIGLEIHKPSIEQVLKQCKLQNIDNILIVDYDARLFLELLDSNSVGKIFVHFPVPWDKKPHRRVISKAFIEESIRVLKQNGKLELRTDSDNYFLYSFNQFMELNQNCLEIRKNQDLEISSKYEDRWKRKQKNIYDIIFTNNIESQQNPKRMNLEFENFIDFEEVNKKFENKVYKDDDYFVHLEDSFISDKKSGVIKLSFGSFERCEHKYIIFKDNKIEYFPNKVLPTKQNIKAHQRIKEFIYG